jgi:uncharacterized membrane protein YfhO
MELLTKKFWLRVWDGFKTLAIIGCAALLFLAALITAVVVGITIIYFIVKFVPLWITLPFAIIGNLIILSHYLGRSVGEP